MTSENLTENMGENPPEREIVERWYYSASQIEQWECQRKYAFKYIAKIPSPPHPSAALGSRVHEILERHVRDGVPLPYLEDREGSEIAAECLPHVPEPHSALRVETELRFEAASGNCYVGYRDLVLPPEHNGGVPVILDYKTTSDFRWAKTPEMLLTNPQAMIYAYHAMAEFRVTEVELRWIYTRTRGARRSKKVSLRVLRDQAVAGFRAVDACASEIGKVLESSPDPLSLDPNPEICEKYGGCPYRGLCNLSPQEKVRALMNASFSNFMSRLGGTAPAPEAAAPAPIADSKGTITFSPSWASAINPPESKPNTTVEESKATHAAKVAPELAAPPPAPPAEKVKRGPRDKKAKAPTLVEAEVPTAVDMNAETVGKIVAAEPAYREEAPTREYPAYRGVEIFVDCVPPEPATHYGAIFEKARVRIETLKGVPHPSAIGFGEARAFLHGAFRELWETLSGPVVVPSTADVFLEVAAANGARIVRGTR